MYIIIRKDLLIFWDSQGWIVSQWFFCELGRVWWVGNYSGQDASEQEVDKADLGKPIGGQRHERPLESCSLWIHFLLSTAEKTGNPSLLAEWIIFTQA